MRYTSDSFPSHCLLPASPLPGFLLEALPTYDRGMERSTALCSHTQQSPCDLGNSSARPSPLLLLRSEHFQLWQLLPPVLGNLLCTVPHTERLSTKVNSISVLAKSRLLCMQVYDWSEWGKMNASLSLYQFPESQHPNRWCSSRVK